MAKYEQEVKDKAVEMIKNGSTLAETTEALGPNPSAIKRYCLKAGVAIPEVEKAEADKEKVLADEDDAGNAREAAEAAEADKE